ncbi:MAG: alpha-E domain-containing protein, partial [Gammaproteobacteria bacterium]
DQVWSFYRLGTFLELCDQVTRLVDMKYHALLPSWQSVGTPTDIAQWNALLRSASAYHGYRRVYPHEMTPKTVAGFILLDPRFPRSIPHCVRQIRGTLEPMLAHPELAHVDFPRDVLGELERLAALTPDEVITRGLHEFADEIQVKLNALSDQIADTFFLARYAA